MSLAEIMLEVLTRGDTGPTYAGGMTRGEIEDIKAAGAAFAAKREAQRRGTSPA